MKRYSISLGGSQYVKFRYPAGECQVRLAESELEEVAAAEQITVWADIRNDSDVVELVLLLNAVRGASGASPELQLCLPYLPYARADRRFVKGDCYGLGAFVDMLTSGGNVDKIVTLDVHSPACPLVVSISPLPLICHSIRHILAGSDGKGMVTVLLPDKGAVTRYDFTGLPVDVKNCDKKRDSATGKLSGFVVPEKFTTQPVLLVDDICDGGGTFVGIADALRIQERTDIELYLYVTNGIFSRGFGELKQRFKRIFTSDSFGSWAHGDCVTLPGRELLSRALTSAKPSV